MIAILLGAGIVGSEERVVCSDAPYYSLCGRGNVSIVKVIKALKVLNALKEVIPKSLFWIAK